jgi:hypothetical protein
VASALWGLSDAQRKSIDKETRQHIARYSKPIRMLIPNLDRPEIEKQLKTFDTKMRAAGLEPVRDPRKVAQNWTKVMPSKNNQRPNLSAQRKVV